MRRTPPNTLLTLLLLPVAAACSVEGNRDRATPETADVSAGAQGEIVEVSDDTSGGSTYESGRAPVTPVPNPGGGQAATGTLRALNDSGLTGSVTVMQAGTGTNVVVQITGAPAGGRAYQAALHEGSCQAPGRQVHALPIITLLGTGAGSSNAIVPVPSTTVLNGKHTVLVHGENAGPATPPFACSDLPQGSGRG